MKRGAWGEQMAAEFLRRQGYNIIVCNFSTRFGEIDIIAQKQTYIIFAEVKTRRDAHFATAREHVTAAKQQRIIMAAQGWLQQNPSEYQPRFDVIEVYGAEGSCVPRKINHLENAFEG